MKRNKEIICLLLAVVILSACSFTGKSSGNSESQFPSSMNEDEETIVLTLETGNKEEDEVTEKIDEEEIGRERYEALLNGKETVQLNSSNAFVSILNPSIYNHEVTLNEYMDNIKEYLKSEWYIEEEIQASSSYAWIDCGGDGKEELALRFDFPTVSEEWTVFMIVHNEGSVLKESFSMDAYTRKQVVINQYGYVESGGSNGATSHTWEQYLIDADGNPWFLYGINSEIDPIFYYYKGESITIPEDLYSKMDAEILEYYFDKGSSGENEYLVLSVPEEMIQDGSIPQHPLRDELEKNGIVWTPDSVIQTMKEKREIETGYVSEMAEAPEADWIPLN